MNIEFNQQLQAEVNAAARVGDFDFSEYRSATHLVLDGVLAVLERHNLYAVNQDLGDLLEEASDAASDGCLVEAFLQLHSDNGEGDFELADFLLQWAGDTKQVTVTVWSK